MTAAAWPCPNLIDPTPLPASKTGAAEAAVVVVEGFVVVEAVAGLVVVVAPEVLDIADGAVVVVELA